VVKARKKASMTASIRKSLPDVELAEANCEISGHRPGSCGYDCQNDGKCGSHYNHCHYPDPERLKEMKQRSAAAEAERKQLWAEYCGSAQLTDWPGFLLKRSEELRSNQLFKDHRGTVGLSQLADKKGDDKAAEVQATQNELWEAHMQRYR
jgi:hypothetical protein